MLQADGRLPVASETSTISVTTLTTSTDEVRPSPVLSALAEALAGAVGSVVAVLAFYPIDIAKTRAQAALTSPSAGITSGHGRRQSQTKIALPTGLQGTTGAGDGGCGRKKGGLRFLRSRTLGALLSIVGRERGIGALSRLYEGVSVKSLQTLVGSFVYFYAYAFIKGVIRRRSGAVGAGPKQSLSPSLNLLAAALAGMVNQAFTLPLENITTKMQVQQDTLPEGAQGCGRGPWTPRRSSRSGAYTTETAAKAGDDEGEGGVIDSPDTVGEGSGSGEGGEREGLGVGLREEPIGDVDGDSAFDRRTAASSGIDTWTLPPEGGFGEENGEVKGGRTASFRPLELPSDRRSDTKRTAGMAEVAMPAAGARGKASPREREGRRNERQETQRYPCRRRQRRQRSLTTVALDLYRGGGGIARFWRGFVPSLVLTCNPAINYTAFDLLKAFWLKKRRTGTLSSGGPPRLPGGGEGEGFLNPLEAFVVAAAAKCLATLVTYPLIRAKVILMTSVSKPRPSGRSTPRSYPAGAGTAAAQADVSNIDADAVVAEPPCAGDSEPGGRNLRAAHERVPSRKIQADGTETMDESLMAEARCVVAVPGTARERSREGGSGDNGERGMGLILAEVLRTEGLGGLYAGCGAQLLHTILKSALLLATKEQIARAAASAVFMGGTMTNNRD